MMRVPHDHPLKTKSATVARARVVLYDKIGRGPHGCHWCGKEIDWMPGAGLHPRAIVADHLNWDRTDDSRDNLVPSCHVCNAHRTRTGDGRRIGEGEPVLMMANGPTRAVEQICRTCGETFLALPAFVRKGKAIYCSRSCARKAPRRSRR